MTTDRPRHDRDSTERALYRGARDRGLPVLGICRGMQVMAVESGGHLVQDLPSAGYGLTHREAPGTFTDPDAAQNYAAIGIGLRGLMRARNAVFACLQRLSMKFHHGTKSGDLIYRASWDTYSVQTLFQQGALTMLKAGLTLVGMTAFMLALNWRLTLVALAIVPLLVAAIRFFGRKMTERGLAAQQADSAVTSHVQQTVTALPLIQSYTREDYELGQFSAQTEDAQKKRLKQHAWELIYWLVIGGIFGLGAALIIWVGGLEVLAGKLTKGDLFIFLSYLGQLYDPLNQLSHVGATVSSASAAAGRVLELLDAPEDVKDAPDARAVVRATSAAPTPATGAALAVSGAIVFDDVHFGYTPDREILKGLTFELRAGESAAVIGPSGVGKTTLMNLLSRFYDPVSGTVRLDGADLRRLKLRDLRSQIAVVLQEPILLPTTIAENIAYGRPNASREEIESAARSANPDCLAGLLRSTARCSQCGPCDRGSDPRAPAAAGTLWRAELDENLRA